MYEDEENAVHSRLRPEFACKLNIANVLDIFSCCSDFEYRNIFFGTEKNIRIFVCWIDGLVSGNSVSEDILRPLTQLSRSGSAETESECFELISRGSVYSCSMKECHQTDELIDYISHGHCALIFDELERAICFEQRSSESRAVSEPTLEKSLKGSKDSFVEVLRINTALVRRRICSPRLKICESEIGRKSHSRVAVIYLDGVASPEILGELAERLDKIDVDALLAVGLLEESIVDCPRSPFPQLLHTERPDRFAMYLMDGRIGILIDGIPIGLVLPVTLGEFLKVTGDSSTHYIVASFLSLLRHTALFLSIYLPALYVAVAMYHQEMIPTKLLLSIIDAKRDVPFTTAFEILSMLIAFSLLQEAGLRLPNPIGDTISIIGVLIVGQSAVEARVVSPIAIIVVAVSGIACYTLPSQDLGYAVRLTRLCMLIAAIVGGLYGIGIASCLLLLQLCSMESFGINYTDPLSSGRKGALRRQLMRPFKPDDKFRDPSLRTPDRRRQI